MYRLLGECDCLVLQRGLYNAWLCDDFGSDGCAGTANLRNNEVSETTLVAGTEWGATTVDCGVDSNGDVG